MSTTSLVKVGRVLPSFDAPNVERVLPSFDAPNVERVLPSLDVPMSMSRDNTPIFQAMAELFDARLFSDMTFSEDA